MNFLNHITTITNKINWRINSLRRIRPYLSIEKSTIIGNAFIMCHFNYCPLIWMFTSKKAYQKLCKVHCKLLKVIYQRYDLCYQELLQLHGLEDIHTKQLKSLMIEIYKSINHLNPMFMWFLFKEKSTSFFLRSGPSLSLPTARTTTYGLSNLVFRGSLTWNSLPHSLKVSTSLEAFKANIGNFKGLKCNCNICR